MQVAAYFAVKRTGVDSADIDALVAPSPLVSGRPL